MSDADRLAVLFKEEALFGVAPGGTYEELRLTSESLGQDTATQESAEIRPDRQISDIVRTNVNAAGDVAFELSYGAFDLLLEAALLSADWSSVVTVGPAVTISFVAPSGNTQVVNDSGSGFGSIVVNQWVRIEGATNATNNGYKKVTAAAAGSITVINPTGVVEAAAASIEIEMGAQIVNGVEFRSFAFEKEFTDLSTEFELNLGMTIDGFNLDVNADAIATGGFTFLGKSSASTAATDAGAVNAAPTNGVINAVDHVPTILEGQASFDSLQLTFALVNNLRQRMQIGVLGPPSIGTGNVGITGTLQQYFATKAIMDKYLNFTTSSLSMTIVGPQGNAYVVDFPNVKYTSGRRVAGGQNTDIIADMAFSAFRHPTEDVTIRITRWVV